MTGKLVGKYITIRGIVQGVGFRPKVYKYARESYLTGWVRNTSAGVEIKITGDPTNITTFCSTLRNSPPPLARIDSFVEVDCEPEKFPDFQIIVSQAEEGGFIPVSPDIALCDDCRREMFDPNDRRFQYPFINCTNCGPRFTIVQDIPYDRSKTTMSGFKMCPDCKREYEDPLDRRFHAQPTACPICGPRLIFKVNGSIIAEKKEALNLTRQYLKDGKIVAIKSLGGYLLACDAYNISAVQELRARKQRSNKPFALMAADLQTIQRHCKVSANEGLLLNSAQHPIVLLERLLESTLPVELAPGQRTLGFMLPYTPHQELILSKEEGFPDVLVMTSGNMSEEPIAFEDGDAGDRLSSLADGFLLHDRSIHIRVDDSVARWVLDRPYILRRARGYAPNPILLPTSMQAVFAAGSELKNTFCLTRDQYAFISHHIGDMENLETLHAFETGIEHYRRLFRIEPEIVACDLHPNYMASNYAREYACDKKLPLIEIQHHHAHLASCMADNGWESDEPVIGVIFDGTGYGTDGHIWGGEFLLGSYTSFERKNHLEYIPLPGGDAAIYHPMRTALAALWKNGLVMDNDLPGMGSMPQKEKSAILAQLKSKVNTPLTSSMGRMFDAVSALLGVCGNATYEGEPAILLETVADNSEKDCYKWGQINESIPLVPIFTSMVADIKKKVPASIISARFHNSIVQLVKDVCTTISRETGIRTIALSGGVWQNMYLLSQTVPLLESMGFEVLWHRQVPTNDGGISFGQAVIAGNMHKNRGNYVSGSSR